MIIYSIFSSIMYYNCSTPKKLSPVMKENRMCMLLKTLVRRNKELQIDLFRLLLLQSVKPPHTMQAINLTSQFLLEYGGHKCILEVLCFILTNFGTLSASLQLHHASLLTLVHSKNVFKPEKPFTQNHTLYHCRKNRF